jgi:hypothetical protein
LLEFVVRRSNWTPSIVPRWDDHDVYLVVDDLGRLGRVWRESDFEETDLETVVTDLLEGQYKNPLGIFAFNTAEGWARDVSADIAAELRRRCDLQLRDVPSDSSSIEPTRSTGHNSRCRRGWCYHEMHPLPGYFWVCDNHPTLPWEGENACSCGGARRPLPRCVIRASTAKRRGCRTASKQGSTRTVGGKKTAPGLVEGLTPD